MVHLQNIDLAGDLVAKEMYYCSKERLDGKHCQRLRRRKKKCYYRKLTSPDAPVTDIVAAILYYYSKIT